MSATATLELDYTPQCVPPVSNEPDPTAENYLNHSHTWLSWLLTVDHKRIGIMYLVFVSIFFVFGGLAAMLVRVNLLTPTGAILELDQYNKAFTAHGTIMLFLFLIPVVPGVLGNFFVPIMIGAKDMAFPKLNLASFYVYAFGACFFVVALISGGLETGWTFYPPYSSRYSHTNVLAAGLGVFILGFSSILTGLNIIATVHKMRCPGMSWGRMPLFVWAMYATSVIQVLATPVLAITVVMLAVERIFGVGIFDPTLQGDPILFQHMFWYYSHPAVYIMILPGMGVINEVITCFSRKNIFGYAAVAWSTIGIAVVGYLVWGHHMFLSGQSYYLGMVFSILTMLVAVPSAIKVFNWTATLYRGSLTFQAPMLYAIGFIILFTIGGLTGIYLGLMGTDIHLHDTYFVIAHFHFTMVGGMMFGWMAGLHYWWPKMTGKMYSDFWSRLAAIVTLVGFSLTFLPQFILGFSGMPRRYPYYPPEFQMFNIFSTAGASIQGIGYLMPLCYLTASLFFGKDAGPNPWRGTGLEWQTASPPPPHNFHDLPHVTCGPYEYALPSTFQYVETAPATTDRTDIRTRFTPEPTVVTNTHDTGARQPIVAHHFNNLLQQQSSVRFGMWLFLVTEVLFFGGVFCAYTVYRMWYPLEFEAGSTALNPLIAGINSFLLLGSSLTATLGIRAAYMGQQGRLKMWLACTILLGCTFLGFKALEYYTDYKEGLIPSPQSYTGDPLEEKHTGRDSAFAHNIEHVLHDKEYYKKLEVNPKTGKEEPMRLNAVNLDRTRLFFVFYYAMTGLHVIHMIVGIGLFIWQYILASRGFFVPQERYVYIEVLALYWHFVELVWIFLLPLLYMAGHHSMANLGF